MQNFAFIRTLSRSRRYDSPQSKQHLSQAGFTLLELLVVAILVGVLAAIASPSWLGFVQQRRATVANDAVARALQEAQSFAKTRKLSYSVSFKNENSIPWVAVYPSSLSPLPNNSNYWRELGEQLSLKPGQIVVRTNLTGPNLAGNALQTIEDNQTRTITFNYLGNLPTGANLNGDGDPEEEGLVIEVAAPSNVATALDNRVVPASRRCVKVRTLLGSIQPARIDQCNL